MYGTPGGWFRKLTTQDVIFIRKLLAEGVPGTVIARLVGTSTGTVSLIKNGHIHKNVSTSKGTNIK